VFELFLTQIGMDLDPKLIVSGSASYGSNSAQDMKFGKIKFPPTRPVARNFMQQKMNISWH
jgi:hypothetical protein